MATKLYIPTFVSNENFEPARVQPRLLYFNGTLDIPEYTIDTWDDDTGATKSVNTLTQGPYFDHYNVVSGSFPTTESDSLLFFNESTAYGVRPSNTLFSKYWQTYIELLYNPVTRLINAEAVIPLSEYFALELNTIVEWRMNYYHLRAIEDYSFTTGECKLQLLGPIISDSLDVVFLDCYSYVINADPESSTTFDWIDCDGNSQSTTLSAGSSSSITCIRPGTITANRRGATWNSSGVCGQYEVRK